MGSDALLLGAAFAVPPGANIVCPGCGGTVRTLVPLIAGGAVLLSVDPHVVYLKADAVRGWWADPCGCAVPSDVWTYALSAQRGHAEAAFVRAGAPWPVAERVVPGGCR